MASSQVVSVRFTTEELQHLQSQQLEGESLSLTIKRLVLGNSICKQPVNTNQADSLKAEIKEELKLEFEMMVQPFRDALLEDREKLERLANTVNDLLESVSNIEAVNTVNTVNNYQQLDDSTVNDTLEVVEPISVVKAVNTVKSKSFENMTKAELKKLLDKNGLKYHSRVTRDELIQCCSIYLS